MTDTPSSEAPKIAANLAAESGWLVKRVSLKSRNASRAQPDHWERAAQQIFNNLRQQVSRQLLQQEQEEPAS